MTIQAQRLSDTTSLLFDLGSAHGKQVYTSVEDFAQAIAYVSNDCDLICFTNSSQTRERSFLQDLGFSMDNIQVSSNVSPDRMMSHFITNEDFQKKFKVVSKLKQVRLEAEKKALEFFFSRVDKSPLKVGENIGYIRANLRTELLIREKYFSTLYQITTILPSGRVKFKKVDGAGVARGKEYLNSYSVDQGYEKEHCYRIDCTQAEFNEKVKEFM